MQRTVNGSVTVFVSMMLLILLAFIGGIIESTSIQSRKSEKRTGVDLAVESVFGEFQKELLEEYDLFAIDAGYSLEEGGEEQVIERLTYYGPANTSYSMQRIQYLTDNGGEIFMRQAVKSMLAGTNLGETSSNGANEQVWQQEQEKVKEYETQQQETDQQLEEALSQTEEAIPKENNPISHMKELGQGNFAKLICSDQVKLSDRSVELAGMPSYRTLKKGRGTFPAEEKNVAEKLLLDEYILNHFEHAAKTKSEDKNEDHAHALDYEIEYLLAGEASDEANLEKTGKKLLLIRMASNYAYLLSDAEKQSEAEGVAAVLSAVVLSPELEPLIKQGLLIAWAYGEGIMDIRSLLAGGKVPLIKNRESWQTDLLGILKIGTGSDGGASEVKEDGMSYMEYLRMLLFLEKKETLSARALDLIESNIKLQGNQEAFRVDQCVTALETEAESSLRRGITYRFHTSYRYQ